MKILAVDYGDSRTGLAVCDPSEILATPLKPQIEEKAMAKVAAKICDAAKENRVGLIVIGLPRNTDHHHRRRLPQRERHLRQKAEGHPGRGERLGDPGELPRLAEKPSRRGVTLRDRSQW